MMGLIQFFKDLYRMKKECDIGWLMAFDQTFFNYHMPKDLTINVAIEHDPIDDKEKTVRFFLMVTVIIFGLIIAFLLKDMVLHYGCLAVYAAICIRDLIKTIRDHQTSKGDAM